MYRISQLMSTPVASKCSTRSNRERTGELAPSCIFPSLAFDFLDGGSPFECCSIDPLTGSHYTCRRSPRLLTNGYYVWTEDSILCDEDGNITLNPSQTTVMYKENLVKIFRRKKRVRRSLPSLFSLSASQSWLCGSVLGDSDTSPHEDIWLEGARRLDSYHSSENEGDFDCSSLTDNLEKPKAASVTASTSSQITSQPPSGSSQDTLQSLWNAPERLQENIVDHSQTSVFPGVSFQAVLLTAGFIISLCARWWIGGVLSNVFTCMLVITIACLPEFDNHLGMPLMNLLHLNIRKLSNWQSAWN
ncbi:transmembrane protein 71 isoform X1 [Marmota marmota marmota]|uniref:transmembrane protein 71 isoform X1 n=1 Tax=Marmota marmota marmota TaxID=9994 RepID=UPI0020931256|nr:transmembrane protein 71 isoform X1 [Marmota marmota marmota]XP_048658113.1 transmembrane protein 71 isoform X1 [Marmota marmota marmota]